MRILERSWRSLATTLAFLSLLNLTAHSQAFGASESLLWSFSGPDGTNPYGSLVMDTTGNFYGTTKRGGSVGFFGSGTVFKLTAPSISGGNWAESVLWSFGKGSDGALPQAGLIMDTNGNL